MSGLGEKDPHPTSVNLQQNTTTIPTVKRNSRLTRNISTCGVAACEYNPSFETTIHHGRGGGRYLTNEMQFNGSRHYLPLVISIVPLSVLKIARLLSIECQVGKPAEALKSLNVVLLYICDVWVINENHTLDDFVSSLISRLTV